MAYTVSVPLANQKIAATQAPIQANFSFINSAMQENHTFNGNALAGEADGSHQVLEFPNQSVDVSVLPTGIATVQYSKSGNLYSYNGTKNPMSGYSSFNLSKALSTSPTALFTVPNDCIGYLAVQANNLTNAKMQIIPFFSSGGTLFVNTSAYATFTASASGLSFQLACTGSSPIAQYKYIYWPV